MIVNTPYPGFAGCAHALSDYDLRPGLAGIRNPVLLICGTKDATYPGIKTINAAVPGSRLVDIEGAGHISNTEQPEKFTGALRDFLKG
jgi:pimeloyl-ACP methyl ester carboxylesterase